MKFSNRSVTGSSILVLCITALLNTPQVLAQQSQKSQAEDVIRVNTDLVQTAITVVDRSGHFVDGLSREQFELTVDGQPRPITFFERVTAGSAREEQLTGIDKANPATQKTSAANATVRGRTIVFFIDDIHQSADSLHRTRDMPRHFLTHEMNSRHTVPMP